MPSSSTMMSTAQPVAEKLDSLLKLVDATLDFAIGGNMFKPKVLRALSGVSFELHAGRSLALVGESGSGKSTIARVLSRIYQPSSGKVEFGGQDISTLRKSELAHFREDVQMIFQDPFGSLNQTHTVGYILERPIKLHRRELKGADVQNHIVELLEQVGLTPAKDFVRRRPHELSGGQRQRVAIARALSVQPKVLLADEPTSMLDVSVRLGILNLLEEQKLQKNLATLFITHDIATARYFAEDTAVLYAGHLVEQGPSEQITSRPQHPYTQLLIDSVPNPDRRVAVSTERKAADIPLWTSDKIGCPFAARCPRATSICSQEMPKPQSAQIGHFVRCHHV